MSYPLDLGDIAREINREQARCWGELAVTVQALVLCEEAGEVARIAAKEAQGIRPETRGKWEEELGDVLIVALGLCALVEPPATRPRTPAHHHGPAEAVGAWRRPHPLVHADRGRARPGAPGSHDDRRLPRPR